MCDIARNSYENSVDQKWTELTDILKKAIQMFYDAAKDVAQILTIVRGDKIWKLPVICHFTRSKLLLLSVVEHSMRVDWKRRPSYHCWWRYQVVRHYWKTVLWRLYEWTALTTDSHCMSACTKGNRIERMRPLVFVFILFAHNQYGWRKQPGIIMVESIKAELASGITIVQRVQLNRFIVSWNGSLLWWKWLKKKTQCAKSIYFSTNLKKVVAITSHTTCKKADDYLKENCL